MSGYSSLAMVYDRLMEVDYSERADYLLSLFSLHGGKYGTLLDLACGSGSLTLELAKRGCDMVAVDG
ncbi:MAG: class I SAM-dependent methyltransferase, partial [Ruminococcaceae bacterium]|nr:class I SAM-dependent methyltransferase [Oscillospiraceae bacterium]